MVSPVIYPKPDAYMVSIPNGNNTVFLDLYRAIDYASQHHGTVKALDTAENHPKKEAFK